MRQIRFRAKALKGRRWVYGDLLHAGTDPADGEFEIMYWDDESGWMQERIDPDTIGQLTSLRDINGKDIYEGDILDVSYADEDSYLEVRFVRGVFAFLWNGDLDDEFPCNAPTHEWAKVIGNIYDDPKLLKQH